jgi:hypothetical protein
LDPQIEWPLLNCIALITATGFGIEAGVAYNAPASIGSAGQAVPAAADVHRNIGDQLDECLESKVAEARERTLGIVQDLSGSERCSP